MESLSPMGRPSTVKEITDAVMYLTDAGRVMGDIRLARLQWFKHCKSFAGLRYILVDAD
jgi:hypothetical protein